MTSINLTATGGGSYSWSDGTNIVGTTATLNVTAPGTYTVTVTLANGCSDTESITITQDIAVPTAGITPPTTTVLTCSVTSINLTATGGGSYSWSDGTNIVGTTATLNVTVPGTYTVTVTLANGCSDTESIEITQAAAITLISANSTPAVNWGDNGTITIIATGGTGTLYYTIGSETNTSGEFIRLPGTWEYSVTDDNGCGPLTGTITVGEPPARTLNIKLYLEGFYDIATNTMVSPLEEGPGGNCDYITVELHNAINYSIVEYTAANVFIKRDGTISITLPSSYNGSYYLSIVHRNSINTVSGLPVPFVGGVVSYDFSDNASKAYGNNMIEVNTGVWAIYAGDVNQDGTVDTADMTPVRQ